MPEEAGKLIDRLHAGVLFSQSFLSSAFEGCMDACQVHDEYLLFVQDFMLYVWFAKDAVFEEPVALMYNVYTATLVSPSCNDFFVINSIGDILVVRFHPHALLPGPTLNPSELNASAEAVGSSLSEEQTQGTHDKPEQEVMEILLEFSLCDYNVEITNCKLRYNPHYQLLLISSESSALVTVLSFLQANTAWTFRGSFTIDLSADLQSIQLASFWGPVDDPYLVICSHGSHLFFQALNSSSAGANEISLRRSRHPTWITALSSYLPHVHPHHSSSSSNHHASSGCWAVTGDTSGYLCFWQYAVYSVPVQRVDDHGNDLGQPVMERQATWKLVYADRDLLAGQAITVVATDQKHAWIGDRAGRVTCVHFSPKTKHCYPVHQLNLFPRTVSISQLSVHPLTSHPPLYRVRAISSEWKECVECLTSKNVSNLRRNWPFPHHHALDAQSNDADPMTSLAGKVPSLTTSRTIHQTVSMSMAYHGLPTPVIQTCVVLAHAQLVAVAGWTNALHLYDLHTNALLQSITLPFLFCSRLAGYDANFAATSSAFLAVGNEMGDVVVYQLVLQVPLDDVPEGSADMLSLRSFSDDSLESISEIQRGDEMSSPSVDVARRASLPRAQLPREAQGVFDLLEEPAQAPLSLEESSLGSIQGQSNTSPSTTTGPGFVPPPLSRQHSAADRSFQLVCTLFHDLKPSLHPISDLLFSSTGDSLLVVSHRRHFFLFSGISTPAAYRPQLQRLERLSSKASMSLDNAATSISVMHPIPDDRSDELAYPMDKAQRLLVVVQIGLQVGLLDALSLTFLSQFSIEPAKALDSTEKADAKASDAEACCVRSVLLWDYAVAPPVDATAGTSSSAANSALATTTASSTTTARPESRAEDDGETYSATLTDTASSDPPLLPPPLPQRGAAGERGLMGLCAQDLCSWMAFGDRQGFKRLAELRSQVQCLLDGHVHSPLDSLLWSMAGFSHDQSPILLAWSPEFILLLRVQLNRDRGPLIMRIKLLHLRAASPQEAEEAAKTSVSSIANYGCTSMAQALHGRVVYAQALPLLPKVRFHQVFIALSSGFSFIVNL